MLEQFEKASGFVFDCDGTLLDTMDAWREVEQAMIGDADIDTHDPEFDDIRAAALPEAARIMHERYGRGASVQELIDMAEERLMNFYRDEVEPISGAPEFIAWLAEHKVPTCVVSSSPTRYLEAGLTHVGMREHIGALISTEDAGMSKQDPRIFDLACEKMGSDPETTWGADDAIYAIRVMASQGFKTIGIFSGDDCGSFDVLADEATIAIRDFTELLK